MKKSLRHFALAGLAALLVVGATSTSARAQFRFMPAAPVYRPMNTMYFNPMFTSPPLAGLNTNYYINPYMTLQQANFNLIQRNAALATTPPYLLGYNPYIQSVNYYNFTPYTYTPYVYTPYSYWYGAYNPYFYGY